MVTFEVDGVQLDCLTSSDLFSPKDLDRGTGLLLEQLSHVAYTSALDWGCGWGAMALWLAAKRPTAAVLGLDSDVGAVRMAQINLERNSLQNLKIIASYGFDDIEAQQFDLIVSNPPTHRGREVVEAMIRDAQKYLVDGGLLAIVVEARLKPWVQRSLQAVFGGSVVMARTNKHTALFASKR